MARPPLFSVITVSLNAADALEATLTGLRGQSCRDFESVVADGGSRDRTAEVVAANRDLIGAFLPGPDAGIYDAMNKALAAARGELVLFLNAGDNLHDADALARIASAYAESAADLLYTDVLLERPDGRSLLRYPELSARFLYRHTLCHQVIVARRSLFDRTGPFDLGYKYCADFDWLMTAVYGCGARVRRVPGPPLAVYDTGGLTGRKYVMHERFSIITRRMPAPLWLWLGTVDALSRALGDGGQGKRVWDWVTRLFTGPTRSEGR
jgi:glycosyltransferase involved in cell wall biosynthesis